MNAATSECDRECQQQQASCAGHADCCYEPNGGGDCQTLDPVLTHKNETPRRLSRYQ